MIREKIIITILGIVILMVFFESVSVLSTQDDSFIHDTKDENERKDGRINETQSPFASLQIDDWGDDIFYDRTNIYNSWFKLTGITQFEDGYKAIINGEITHELNRVRGFTVIEINKDQVALERDQYSVTLKLEK
jgi:LPS sulfotransferase NodH